MCSCNTVVPQSGRLLQTIGIFLKQTKDMKNPCSYIHIYRASVQSSRTLFTLFKVVIRSTPILMLCTLCSLLIVSSLVNFGFINAGFHSIDVFLQHVLSMLLVQDDGQELLQACISEQWDVAKVLIVTGSTLEAQDKVMSSLTIG